jgi:eukaryotic-like serine/threonine-protein kinase
MMGKRIGSRYDIEERIGEGGMAVVYRARDILLNRTVALKVLRSQFGNDDDFIARFHREAQAAASLSHPNVVNIYDLGQEEDIYYIVMEYVEGKTLKKYINESAPLDVKEAVEIAIQICDALDHAHTNELIHRDIKPHNILINKHGRIKVTDFGIARAVSSVTITHTGSVLGSVHYFSPEQAKGVMAGAKSDLYSLGIVIYEMLTGELPFSGDSPISVALKHLQEPYIPPRKLRPEIPQSIENIITRALAKEPMYRYESAHEMLLDLRTCLSPDRKNEAVYVLPEKYEEEEDAQITRVIPAIKPEMLRRRSWSDDEVVSAEEAGNIGGQPEDQADENEESRDRKAKRSLKKALLWTTGICLFLVLVGAGIFYATTLFKVPDVKVPSVQNMALDQARKTLEDAKLKPVIQQQYNKDVAAGHVIKQTPPANILVKENTEVQLFVSQGKQKIAMSGYVGKKLGDIEGELQTKYKSYTTDEISNDEQPAGTVLEQNPPAGTEIAPDETEVKLVVSKGKEKLVMPQLVGFTEQEAQAKLDRNNLQVEISRKPSYEPEGTVLSQSYPTGERVTKGTTVRIEVSSGLPGEAKSVKATVDVYLNQGEKATIEIKVSDARGDNHTAGKYPIDKSMQFSIPCVVSPQKDAVIEVYRDGTLIEQKQVKYSDYQ